MNRKINIAFIVIFLIIIFFVPVGSLLADTREYSVFENRTLAQKPQLTLESVKSGEFSDDAETYFKDHVIFRNMSLKTYTAYQKYLLAKPCVNDIFEADGELLPYLEPKYSDSAEDAQINAELEQLKKLRDAVSMYGGRFIYIGVPGQITMFADLYPECISDIPYYNINTAQKFENALENAGIEFLRGADFLSKDMYFKVDHHFSVVGGYAVYNKICALAGVQAIPEDNFRYYELPNPFLGSRNRKIYNFTNITDRMIVFESESDVWFERYDNGEKTESKVLFLPETDSETVTENYMGGDIAETVIKTNRPWLPDLLIYGDSYTNAVECFAYLSFDETRSLDLRHYDQMTLCEYVKKYKPDFVICIRDDGNYTNTEGNGKTDVS